MIMRIGLHVLASAARQLLHAAREKWRIATLLVPLFYGSLAHAVIGGTAVSDATAYPFMAQLSRAGEHWCGGVLVAPRLVITAAHCVYRERIGDFTVTLGLADLTKKGQGYAEVIRRIRTAAIHPNYKYETGVYDFAILELDADVPLQTNIAIARRVQAPAAGSTLAIVGWGRTSATGPTSPVLRAASVKLLDQASCRGAIEGDRFDYNYQLCTTGLNPGAQTNTCRGDSGGPLLMQQPDLSWAVVGVSSYTRAGCNPPAVFTDTSHTWSRGWIDQWIALKNTVGRPVDMSCRPEAGVTNCSIAGPWSSQYFWNTTYRWYSNDTRLRLLSGHPLTPPLNWPNGTIRFGRTSSMGGALTACPSGTSIMLSVIIDPTYFPGHGGVGSVTRACP